MRRTLPMRRGSRTMNFEHDGRQYVMTYSPFPDGSTAEVFLNTGMKLGSQMDVSVQDGAVLLSIALQYGVPLGILKSSVKRNADGMASSPLGAAIDALVGETS